MEKRLRRSVTDRKICGVCGGIGEYLGIDPAQAMAFGDDLNDLGMIRASKAGFLFKSTEQIKADNPDLPAFEEFDEFLEAIRKAL